MKLLLVVARPLAFEEALFARRLLQQLPASVAALAVCHPLAAYCLIDDLTQPDNCPWDVLTWEDGEAARERVTNLATDFGPDLVLVADPDTFALAETPIPAAWLTRFEVPVVALDIVGDRPGGPWQQWLTATPPQPATGGPAWQPFAGLEGPLQRYATREALLGRHGASPDSLIAIMPFSLPVQTVARVRLLGPWYQTMIDLVSYHLQSLGRPVLLLVTTPGCPQPSEQRRQVRLATYDDLIPSLLETYLAAADLVIVEQAWRFWRYQALAWGIPVAVLASSLMRGDGDQLYTRFGKVDPALLPILDRLEEAAPHAIIPFSDFPQPAEHWPVESFLPEQLWARLDLFDAKGCAEVLQRMLSGEELPRWQPAVADFLAKGKGAQPLLQTFKQLAGSLV